MDEVQKRALRILLGDRPIAYHPIFAKAMGCVAGGVWLSQIAYWDSVKLFECEKKGVEYDGWFYKTNAEIIGETCLSDRENREAKKRAQELAVVVAEKRGAPPTTWYRLDVDKLEELLNGTPLPIQAVRRRTIQTVQSHAQILPQSTQESTQESTLSGAKDAPQPLPEGVKVFREVRRSFPTKETYAMIEEAVGSLPENLNFWKQVLVQYAALGWNPRNVAGALEFYKRRELPKAKGGRETTGEQLRRLFGGNDGDRTVDCSDDANVIDLIPVGATD